MATTNVLFRETPVTTGGTRHLSLREAGRRTSGANVGQAERVASAALGGTLLLLGLGRRSLGGAAVAALGGGLVYRAATGHCHLYEALGVDTAADRGAAAGASEDSPEAVVAITIGKPAEDLERLWRDPRTLTRITSGFAEVTPAGDGRMRWKVRGPLGRDFEWDTQVVEDRPGSGQRWQSVDGASLPSEGEIHFRPAPGDRGTEVTLRIRFNMPGGALGLAAAKLLGFVPKLFAERAIHYFRALAETGEIPTTERQPAARADTR
ncbi:SRPBCC family protein [Tautonia plasticadhaerens]|uniref:Uncharacterized protein n=1 Tax=Tautonia plasticadhaerens TaxID=2527974 RepID=A0A518H7Z8_9BACT|nr:SRPBCC family protein [Tautonia plasticadhaerens]QDV36987.1 hypothetical protein ElP_49190 [Tautonia plasticadhaerens]